MSSPNFPYHDHPSILRAILPVLSPFTCLPQQTSDDIRHDIFRTLTYYFHGFESNDPDALSSAYYEQATFTILELGEEGKIIHKASHKPEQGISVVL